MPFDASKPYSEAPTKSGFNPALGYSDSPPAPQEKPDFGGSAKAFGVSAASEGLKTGSAIAGAELGAEGGAALGAFGGPFAPVTVPVGGILGGLLGGIGGYYGMNKLGEKFWDKSDKFKKLEKEHPAASEAGRLAVDVPTLGYGVYGLGKALAPGASRLVGKVVGSESGKRTAALAEGLESGQIGKNILSRANKAATRRKDVGNKLYEIAEDRMNAKFKKGDVWQQSPSGRAFFKSIGDQLNNANGTNITSDTRKVLLDLAREIFGTAKEDGGVAYSTPKVLTTTLRELRDAAAGDPKEGFKAIGQQEAGNLAKQLSEAIGKWEPSTQSADAQYAFHTKALYPKGVVGGKFSKEKKTAEKTINLLETRLKQGSIKPEEVTSQVRSALKSPSIARLVSESDARQINTELDAIDKIKAHEDRVRAIAKFSAKWIGGGALAGLGLDVLKGLH